MDPLTAGLMTGASSLIGSMFSSSTSAQNTQANIQAQEQMQAQTEQFNANQAQVQRDYETQMSNSAYQRASKDMQAAGLNPMMMFGSGGPSSTPSVSAPSVGTPNMALSNKTSAMAGIGDAVSKAVNSAVTAQTFDKMVQEVSNMRTQQAKTAAETVTEERRPELIDAERRAVLERAEDTRQSAALKRQDQILRGPATMEAEGVLELPQGALKNAGQIKYGAGTLEEIATPLLNSALRAKGFGMLRKGFDAQEAARAAR